MNMITEDIAAKIQAREPFGTTAANPWTVGYVTKGGVYMIASSGAQTDSGRPRDLVAVDPGGNVHQVWIAVDPRFMSEVAALF